MYIHIYILILSVRRRAPYIPCPGTMYLYRQHFRSYRSHLNACGELVTLVESTSVGGDNVNTEHRTTRAGERERNEMAEQPHLRTDSVYYIGAAGRINQAAYLIRDIIHMGYIYSTHKDR